MPLTRTQFVEGVAGFVEDEMVSVLTGGSHWAAMTALVLLTANAETLLGPILDNRFVKMLGITDKDGDIDIDKAHAAFKKASQSGKFSPVTISLRKLGLPDEFDLKPSDIDKLYGRLKQMETPRPTADARERPASQG